MKSIDNIEVGKRIKEIRLNSQQKKLTQLEFAELLNPPVNRSAVKNWENGNNLPNTNRLQQIASIGNTSIELLLFGEEYSSSNPIETFKQTQNLIFENFISTPEEIIKSEEFFSMLDLLRNLQVDNKKVFDLVVPLIYHITYLAGTAPNVTYSKDKKELHLQLQDAENKILELVESIRIETLDDKINI
ncbi:helix-turn-helix domain-containing protein [Vagococcus fluvialis]|uniref:helix-turn-helix domain-containing protein n=1 Tax=Vagococcus fluvialis TaxID=2738 RepID=UPI0037B7EAA3